MFFKNEKAANLHACVVKKEFNRHAKLGLERFHLHL